MNTELYTTKVDKVVGKELSSNDFTDANVVKLGGIEDGAEVNVQADWEQSDDTADDYIKNKPTELFSSVGYFHYTDTATQTTPLTILPDTNKKLTNDGLGAQTNLTQAPYGVSTLFNTTTNEFDFSQLSIGDTLDLRVDLSLTTTSANQKYLVFLRVGEGSVAQYDLPIFSGQIKNISSNNRIIGNEPFSIDYQEHIDNPATLYILSDDDGSVKVNGWYAAIIRKSINIVSFPIKEDKVSGVIAFGSDDYTATVPEVTELVFGYKILCSFENSNTGASTINVNGLGVKEIRKQVDVQLVADDLLGVHFLMYDGTYFQLVGYNDGTGGGGSPTWGDITGTLSAQTDLQTVLDEKQSKLYYNVKDYGALGDGTTDDTEAIQETINTVFANGGGVVYFPIGIYIIGGALLNNVGTDLVDYNSQLYIPQVDFDNLDRCTISFLGEVAPNLFQSLGIGVSVAPNTGVILRSTIQGSGTRPSVICNKGADSNAQDMSFTNTLFKNISIQITPNDDDKLTMGGINCEFSAIANFEYVTVFPYNLNLADSGEPNVIDIVGIAMPGNNCEHINTIKNCTVGGFTHGYLLGEHSSAYDAIANCCVNGFTQNTANHIGNYVKISAFWCRYDFNVIGISNFVVQALQTEWATQSKWYDSLATVKDTSNYGRGTVNYNIVSAGVGLDNTKFKKIDGLNIKTRQISYSPIKAITGTSYTLGAGDSDYDLIITTNNSPVTITVPLGTTFNFDIGCSINFTQYGDGKISFVAPSGLEIRTTETLSLRKKYASATLIKQYINDWVLTGDLELV